MESGGATEKKDDPKYDEEEPGSESEKEEEELVGEDPRGDIGKDGCLYRPMGTPRRFPAR